MNIGNIVDNDITTDTVKNIYKFIDKHDTDILKIFNTVFDDLKSIFSDVTLDDDTIHISLSDTNNIDSVKNMVSDIIVKHTNDIIGSENTNVIPYVFKTVITGKNVTVLFKK